MRQLMIASIVIMPILAFICGYLVRRALMQDARSPELLAQKLAALREECSKALDGSRAGVRVDTLLSEVCSLVTGIGSDQNLTMPAKLPEYLERRFASLQPVKFDETGDTIAQINVPNVRDTHGEFVPANH